MALRFRKSIKLAPGIRWNISGSGSSWTLGPRGASIGIGKRGAFLNTGIPATGISFRSPLMGSPSSKVRRPEAATNIVSMTCEILIDGRLSFTDQSGVPISEREIEEAKKQNRDTILSLIQRKCDEINEQIEVLGKLHFDTPNPSTRPRFSAPDFPDPKPTPTVARQPSLIDRLVPWRAQKIAVANRNSEARFLEELADWEVRKKCFDSEVSDRKRLVESLIYTDVGAMEKFLQENLEDIGWPRETVVAFEVNDGGRTVALSVDLPEVEDMPNKLAVVPVRGMKLSVKDLTATKIQKLYAEHIHGVVFRLVGEVFAALPNVLEVVASGYSQRRNPTTAQLQDDYLLSVRVPRSIWNGIDFGHLSTLNVPEALSQFDLRREMSKSGVLKAITPHAK